MNREYRLCREGIYACLLQGLPVPSHTRKSSMNYANYQTKNDEHSECLDVLQLRNNVTRNWWPDHYCPLIERPQNYCNYVYLGFRMNLLQPLFCYVRQRHSVIQAEIPPYHWNPLGEGCLAVHHGIASYDALLLICQNFWFRSWNHVMFHG